MKHPPHQQVKRPGVGDGGTVPETSVDSRNGRAVATNRVYRAAQGKNVQQEVSHLT